MLKILANQLASCKALANQQGCESVRKRPPNSSIAPRTHPRGASGPPLMLAIPFSCAARHSKPARRSQPKGIRYSRSSCRSRLPHSQSRKHNDERPPPRPVRLHERRRSDAVTPPSCGRRRTARPSRLKVSGGASSATHFIEGLFAEQGARVLEEAHARRRRPRE